MIRATLAEAIGTFALVFAGAGAIMVDAETRSLGQVGIALTFALVIMAMIYAVGHVSGAHFNPAVTVAFALTRHFPWTRAAAYVAAALAAAALLRASLGDVAGIGATASAGSQAQSFLWEVVLSFFLMFVIMAVATDTRAVGEAAALAIGGTVALDALVGGPVSGASMNPARSFGRALVAGELGSLWSTSPRRSWELRSVRSPTRRFGASPGGWSARRDPVRRHLFSMCSPTSAHAQAKMS